MQHLEFLINPFRQLLKDNLQKEDTCKKGDFIKIFFRFFVYKKKRELNAYQIYYRQKTEIRKKRSANSVFMHKNV